MTLVEAGYLRDSFGWTTVFFQSTMRNKQKNLDFPSVITLGTLFVTVAGCDLPSLLLGYMLYNTRQVQSLTPHFSEMT